MAKEERSILIFNLGKDEFAFDVSYVLEVIPSGDIYKIPMAPEFITGMIKLRRHMVAVIDLSDKLKIKNNEKSLKKMIIISKINNFILGFIIDSVKEVTGLTTDKYETAPVEDNYVSAIARIGGRVVTILDPKHLLTNEEINKLSRINK